MHRCLHHLSRSVPWVLLVAVMVLPCRTAAGPTGAAPPACPSPMARPAASELLGCTLGGELCIHATRAVTPSKRLERVLRAAEQALDGLRTLGMPAPAGDCGGGGTLGYDLYVTPANCPAQTVADGLDPTARFDRASAFSLIPVPGNEEGCRFESTVARAMAEAILLGLDAGAHPATRAMHASYLATLVAPCTPLEAEAVDAFQRFPERSLHHHQPGTGTLSGALLWPWFLDAAWGTGNPGAVMTALMAISLQRSASGGTLLSNEPDIFDSLRRAARARATALGDILLDFAVARAFIGSRSDGAHLPDTERYGDWGRPRFEWSIPFSSLPRRLAPLWPMEPTGVTYLWLDLKDAPPAAGLRFVADWEEGLVLRWALSKVDAHGREVGRLTVPGKWGHHQVHSTVADLDGLAGIIIVGTHVGGDDRSHPHDPDEPGASPSLYAVTLAALDE